MGVDAFKMDGNNPTSLAEELGSIVGNVRMTSRPSFIECDTYRLREHCGPNFDDDLKYRDEKELEAWKAKEPISSLISHLELTENDIVDIKEGITLEINEAFDFAETSPFPNASEAFTGEFATL